MWNKFCRGLALVNCCESLANLQVFTPLYRGVKDTLLIASTSKESLLKLDQITNDLLLDLVIVLRGNNFKFIPCIEEYQRSHSCCSCTIADTKQSNGEGGCTICTIVLFQRSSRNKHPMTSNSSELAVAPGFNSFCNDRHD
jgi:hypothetical protein